MRRRKGKILIIDDFMDNIKILISLLECEYEVYFAKDGVKGIEMAKEKQPDVILLDIMMAPIDGYEVCKQLKSMPKTAEIPVIFLTAASESLDEAKGFEVGCSDYITKPFVPIIILARIKNHMKLSHYMKEMQHLYSLALDANPMTKLPGNNSINNHLRELIKGRKKTTVFYIDLDNFKAFNDKYGFSRGDEVIQETAHILEGLASEMKIQDFFLGHIGGDDFVLTVNTGVSIQYIEGFIKAFDRVIQKFYTDEDLKKGYIRMKNRQGAYERFSVISVSIVGIDLSYEIYDNELELSDAFATLKKRVKKLEGSNYLMDRRKTKGKQ
jgi:diguanylate cyclase (GGDEF)-like protein